MTLDYETMPWSTVEVFDCLTGDTLYTCVDALVALELMGLLEGSL
jgi:hypothetical protein